MLIRQKRDFTEIDSANNISCRGNSCSLLIYGTLDYYWIISKVQKNTKGFLNWITPLHWFLFLVSFQFPFNIFKIRKYIFHFHFPWIFFQSSHLKRAYSYCENNTTTYILGAIFSESCSNSSICMGVCELQ